MYNVDVKREGDSTLVIRIDLDVEGRPSKSGRSTIVATTEGNVDVQVDGETYVLGLNLFKPKGRKRQAVAL